MRYLVIGVPLAIVLWFAYGAYSTLASVEQKLETKRLGTQIQRALE